MASSHPDIRGVHRTCLQLELASTADVAVAITGSLQWLSFLKVNLHLRIWANLKHQVSPPPPKKQNNAYFLEVGPGSVDFFGGPFGDDDLRVTWRSWMQHHMKTMSLKKTHRLQIVMGYLWKSDKSMLNPQGFMVPSDATIETNGYGSECWILQRMRIKHGQKRHCPINKLYKVPSNYKLVNESFQMNSKCRSL